MTDAQHETLRHQMSGIADIALACEAKVGNCVDLEERVNIIHDHAARIARAALAICPPERLADVAEIFAVTIKKPVATVGTAGSDAAKPQYNPFMIGPFKIEHVSSKTITVYKVRIGERVFSCETCDNAGA